MKTTRKVLAIAVMTLILAVSASAGNMPGGVIDPPPPPPEQSASTAASTSTSSAAAPAPLATDPIAEVVLDLLTSLFALF